MKRLEGKVAIITGAARGMGVAHARRLAREGAKVALADIDTPAGEAEAARIGGSVRFFAHDVTDAESWRVLVEAVEEEFGPVSVLVNNAGVGGRAHIEDLKEAEYHRIIAVNQHGVFLGMKAVTASMRRAGGGSIINISSTCGFAALPGSLAYSATKFAIRGMTKAAAIDLGPDRIRVNSVHPGLTRTEMLDEGIEAAFRDKTALRRVADADEISSLVVYLASDDASYSTGAEFLIDGGLLAQH